MRHQEVTVQEFWRLCNRRKYGYEVSLGSTATFLERCRELGLVTKDIGEDHVVRYSATSRLLYLLPEDDE